MSITYDELKLVSKMASVGLGGITAFHASNPEREWWKKISGSFNLLLSSKYLCENATAFPQQAKTLKKEEVLPFLLKVSATINQASDLFRLTEQWVSIPPAYRTLYDRVYMAAAATLFCSSLYLLYEKSSAMHQTKNYQTKDIGACVKYICRAAIAVAFWRLIHGERTEKKKFAAIQMIEVFPDAAQFVYRKIS